MGEEHLVNVWLGGTKQSLGDGGGGLQKYFSGSDGTSLKIGRPDFKGGFHIFFGSGPINRAARLFFCLLNLDTSIFY
jgi:hypothetical protein